MKTQKNRFVDVDEPSFHFTKKGKQPATIKTVKKEKTPMQKAASDATTKKQY